MKTIAIIALVLGCAYGLYGLAYLVFRWELPWLAKRGQGALSRTIAALAYAVFLILIAIPIVAEGKNNFSNALTIVGLVFCAVGVVFSFTRLELRGAATRRAADPAPHAEVPPPA